VRPVESVTDKVGPRRDAGSGAEERKDAARSTVSPIVGGPFDPSGRVPGRRQVVIDREALRAKGFLPDPSKSRQFADYYRRIKRPVIAQAHTRPPEGSPDLRLVMTTSALPGDGKTFTSIGLALSIAREQDVSVVLVDADVAKQHVSRLLGIEGEPGLLNAVIDPTADVESLILSTSIPGMSVLPAGVQHDRATELLASVRMTQVAAAIIAADPRRIALFDSPPLLSSSESRAMVQVLGQVVLVVRSGLTPQQALLDAIACVPEDKPIGLVLNGRDGAMTDGYYDGYYAQTGEASDTG
jgi:protein-tyrosine kinase